MNEHLLAISIGPVQGFIAAARRTRDLWFGSHMLSEISKAVANAIYEYDGPIGNGRLIFPYSGDLKKDLQQESEFDVVNIVLADLEDGVDPQSVASKAKNAAFERWKQFAEKAYIYSKEDIASKSRWDEHLEDVVEFYTAWFPYSSREQYRDVRAKLMRLLAARKGLRDFVQAPRMDKGLPKSSLDGARPTVLRELSESELEQYRNRGGRRKSGLWTRPGEQLDVVGVMKRCEYGHDDIRYPSVSRFATDPWLRGVYGRAKKDNGVKDSFDALIRECRKLANRTPKVLRERSSRDLQLFPLLQEFPFEGTPVYFQRHRELAEDCPDPEFRYPDSLRPLRKALENLTKIFGDPDPYLVVLAADGDRMGKTISGLQTLGAHRIFSKQLSEFARRAHSVVRKHRGAAVFSGGDDVLAFLPLDTCLACARELHEEFGKLMGEAVERKNIASQAGAPTLSVGIAIGHFMEPMEDLLEYARAAEKAAKRGRAQNGSDERNGLAIAVHPHRGVPFTVREQWNDVKKEESLDQRILIWANLFRERFLPSKAAYDLRELSRGYDNWPEHSQLAEALRKDAMRLFRRKRGAPGSEAVASIKRIHGLLEKVLTADELRHVAGELLVAHRIAAAMDQAEGKRSDIPVDTDV